MYIRKILVKKRYGWRSVSLRDFLRSHTIEERWLITQDPQLASCMNEFGEVIDITLATKLLEELEASLCTTMGDLKNFLLVYPDGEYEEFAKEKIRSLRKRKPRKRPTTLEQKPEPEPAPNYPVEIESEKKEAVGSLESS